MAVECGLEPELPEVEFTDNCTSSLNITYDEEIIENTYNAFSYDIVRTWTATDNCFNAQTVTQTVHMINTVESYKEVHYICINEEPVDLNWLIDNDYGGTWSGDMQVLDQNNMLDPTIVPEGSYTFDYTGSLNECVFDMQLTIVVNDDCIDYPCVKTWKDVKISKLVTPNGDFKNDVFEVSYELNPELDPDDICDIKTVVTVFNRWGSKVFESRDYTNTWGGESPGASLGAAQKLPAGTYYYVIDLVNSGLKPKQGYILLGVEE